MHSEIKINNKCTLCLSCKSVCPSGSINLDEDKFIIDHFSCTMCEFCALVCPEDAISIDQ